MIFNLRVVCACLTFMATTNGWIFRTKSCITVYWSPNPDNAISRKVYRCDALVEQSGNLSSVVGFVGNHLQGKSHSDIEFIRTDNSSTFTSIPSNLGNFLPKLIAIEFRAEQITSVSAEDLKQFPNLVSLSISYSPIASIDADLFKYTPLIQALIIPGNNIESVGQGLLANLVYLNFVDFHSNPCLNYYASKPYQMEWLKNNLSSHCPANVTSITTQTSPQPTNPTSRLETQTIPTSTIPSSTIPSSTIPTSTIPTSTTPSSTIPTSTIPTSTIPTSTIPTSTIPTTTPTTTTAPVDHCNLRCSLNEETEEVKDVLIELGKLIRDLFQMVSDHSTRIYELESFVQKISNAV